mmetsp:Transcript_21978/g.46191  ORF Transcript_21978/g.46191 Transcript_21978/m.46191 type:complete len:127 (+) Transcript_21978:1054-1434(+)
MLRMTICRSTLDRAAAGRLCVAAGFRIATQDLPARRLHQRSCACAVVLSADGGIVLEFERRAPFLGRMRLPQLRSLKCNRRLALLLYQDSLDSDIDSDTMFARRCGCVCQLGAGSTTRSGTKVVLH